MKPTVVIPIGAWEERWSTQLWRVARQAHMRGGEAVIVDARPHDRRSPDLQTVLPAKGAMVIELATGAGPAVARNAGAFAGQGDLLCFCDVDDLVAHGWVDAFLEASTAHTVLGGVCEHRCLNDGWWHSPTRLDARISLVDVHGHRPFFQSCNLAIRRHDFESLGGFCETFKNAAGEDVDLCWRALRANMKLQVVDDALVHYRLRESFTSSVRQAYGYGRADAALARRHARDGMPVLDFSEALREVSRGVKETLLHPAQPSRYADVVRTAATWTGRLAAPAAWLQDVAG